MKLAGKKILLTGGAGFIGSHLVDALVEENQVTVVDNLSSGKIENMKHLLDRDRITFIQGDITDLDKMRSIVRDHQVIFHLAVQCLRISLADPYLVHAVNATGSLNMCQAAREAGIERFVYVSSSEVYGTARITPMNEDHPLIPTTPYGASKLAGEAYARSYYLAFELPVIIVRPFNTYGPREHRRGVYGEVLPRFVERVMKKQEPVIFGDGLQTRDFTHISDTVKGIIKAAECDALLGEAVNIAAGREVSINDLASIVIRLLGQEGKIKSKHTESRPADVRRHYADISKARQSLGFEPLTGIEAGVQQYIAWVQQQGWDLSQLQNEETFNWRIRQDV